MASKILLLLLIGILFIALAMRACYRAGYDDRATQEDPANTLYNLPEMRNRDSMNPIHIRL